MQLLHFPDDGIPCLKVVGSNLQPYAILSHTWGQDDQEVTYQDIRDSTGEHKDGWQKIRFCRDQAKRDGLQYFWIDTCCIDKSSSAELSEAINSMFSWYRKAERCYVYLTDVSNNTSEAVSEDARRWKPAFKKSAWFTRGWTLQELIAPKSVEFFSNEGTKLGNRESLQETIHEVTSIPVEALRGAPLSQFSKAVRFSWAASRKTKREEDAAYCLLGLFDVFISPIYGEGRKNALTRLDEQIEKASKTQLIPLYDEEKGMLMESLRFEQIDARHTTIRSAHAKTCKWLLSNSEYCDWVDLTKLSEHHGFLWIRGKPGTGKSTLMKFALANARKTMKESIVIAFFFNARGEDMEKSTVGTYRSLLLLLLERVPKLQCTFELLSLSASKITTEYQWSVESLEMLLEQAMQSLGDSSVVCFIDALDECEEQQIRDMIRFFERLGELTISASTRFQVCFSSRHYPNITIHKGLNLVLEGQEGHSQDIVNYVKSELKIGESKIAQQIRSSLQEKASGVFMWVVLVVDILKQEYDRGRIHALKRRLHEIPANLYELFHDILTRDSRNQDELILCIQWVLYAKQPLSPEQLYYAVLAGVEPDMLAQWDSEETTKDAIRRFIIDASKGLTETTKSKSQKVQFIHESVRDFLLKDDGLGSIWPDLRNNFRGQSHERLKQCCLTYMSVDVETPLEFPESLPKAPTEEAKALRDSAASLFPFLEYSVQNVLYHADKAEEAQIIQQDFVREFPLARWIKLDNLFEKHEVRRHTSMMSTLYVLAERNMPSLIRSHPSVRSCFEVGRERYGPPFFAAVATRSKEAVYAFVDALFIDEDHKSDSQMTYAHYLQDKDCQSLIARDFKFPKNTDLVTYLMDSGNNAILALVIATCETNFDVQGKGRRTALMWAVRNRYSDVVKSLLSAGKVDVNAKDSFGWTPLMQAAQGGDRDAFELLLSTGKVEVDVKDNDGQTALMVAAREGHKDVVEQLLSTGKVDVDARDMNGWTSLMWASEKGYKDVVEQLLSTGQVDVDAKSNDGRTPLMRASEKGYKDVFEQLLSTGQVDLNVKSNNGRTPLMWASERGHKDVVEQLLSTGKVDVDARDMNGWTSLMWAAKKGYKDVVEQLLSLGKVDVDARDINGWTSLMWAAEKGYKDVVEQLLSTGQVDLNVKSNNGRTPLMWASERGHKDVVEQLLSTGKVNLNLEDEYGWAPLMWAVRNRHMEVVELLLSTGKVDVDSKNKDGRTPLMWAAEKGHEDVVEQLLSIGKVEVDLKSKNGSTALMLAAREGHKGVVKMLLSTGKVNIDMKDDDQQTPLFWAVMNRHMDVVEQLLSTGKVDINVKDKDGWTPLMLAARYGRKNVVEQFLSTGKVDVDSKDKDGWTPLMLATRYGHRNVVEQFLSTGKVDVDSKNKDGWTPLMLATRYGYRNVVEQLLSTGKVDVNSKDKDGWTPLMLAARHGYRSVVEQLLSTSKVDVDATDINGWGPAKWAGLNGHWEIVQLLESPVNCSR